MERVAVGPMGQVGRSFSLSGRPSLADAVGVDEDLIRDAWDKRLCEPLNTLAALGGGEAVARWPGVTFPPLAGLVVPRRAAHRLPEELAAKLHAETEGLLAGMERRGYSIDRETLQEPTTSDREEKRLLVALRRTLSWEERRAEYGQLAVHPSMDFFTLSFSEIIRAIGHEHGIRVSSTERKAIRGAIMTCLGIVIPVGHLHTLYLGEPEGTFTAADLEASRGRCLLMAEEVLALP